ncbi:hypothetical protein [Selenomonas ruminantium]|uniref:hypothetical protein n=1 Tax=Selenomonas ruminantium TaxID=971 RepID=UPI0026E9AE4D|nr:hypothetical protein [Selenomonas ruminantium]
MKNLDEIMKVANDAAKLALWTENRTELEKFLMLVIASFALVVARKAGTIKGGDLNMEAALVGATKGCYEGWDAFQNDGKDYVRMDKLITLISANVAAACWKVSEVKDED